MTLKQALWEIVRDENIIITNQNIDWLLDRASKKATGDAQALKESILERKRVIEENIPPTLANEVKVSEKDKLLLINENKSNNFDVKSNEELFKQALVEGVNRHFDKTIEEAKKIEQIEEMAEIIHKADVNNDTNTIYFPLSMAECLNKHGAKRTNESIALYNAGYRKQSENTVELPCKGGDTIYLPWQYDGVKAVAFLTVKHIIISEHRSCIRTDFFTDDEGFWEQFNGGEFNFSDFGNKVFVSKDEAEKALAKMKGGAE